MKLIFILPMLLSLQLALAKNNLNAETPPSGECKQEQFFCDDSSNICIPKKLVCDGIYDCRNGNDEVDCSQIKKHNLDDETDLNRDIPTFNLEFGAPKPI